MSFLGTGARFYRGKVPRSRRQAEPIWEVVMGECFSQRVWEERYFVKVVGIVAPYTDHM
jgi:hypothetical protein